MLWIPTAFVCLVSGECAFHYSYVERYLHECEAVNRKAVHKMQADPDVRAYDVTCIQVLLKETGNANNEELQPSGNGQERYSLTPRYGQYSR